MVHATDVRPARGEPVASMGPRPGHGASRHHDVQSRRRPDYVRPLEQVGSADECPSVSIWPHRLGEVRHAQQPAEPGDGHLPAAAFHRGSRQQLRPVQRLRQAPGPDREPGQAGPRIGHQPGAVRRRTPADRNAQRRTDARCRRAGRRPALRCLGHGSGRAARRAGRTGDHSAADDHGRRRQGRSADDAGRPLADPPVHPRRRRTLRGRKAHRAHARRAQRAARPWPGPDAARDAARAAAGDGGRDGHVLPRHGRRDVRP
ncbi:hypothetical protein PAERUG_P54_1_London_24_VIM_2_04_13_01237 [Pseudomonas aeruginosa]|nr:hypothetical protein PAERUG_P54_1_London_24_VIM_2_04_13_01237 [Pseudomonas aeruginosa]